MAEPDRGMVVRLGELALVPGECADAPSEHPRGVGALELELEDGSRRTRSVRLPRGRVTTVRIDERARARASRDTCTLSPTAAAD